MLSRSGKVLAMPARCLLCFVPLLLFPHVVQAQSSRPAAVLTITREFPKADNGPDGRPPRGYQTATVTIIRDGVDRYVVGAYHSLFKANKLVVSLPESSQSFPLQDTTIEDGIFYDRLLDVFVTKLEKSVADQFSNVDWVLPGIPSSDLGRRKAEGELLGFPANAIGNPEIKLASNLYLAPQNITYSCTISDFGVLGTRALRLVAPDVEAALRDKAMNLPRMYIESLSVSPGFSGGPVISNPQALAQMAASESDTSRSSSPASIKDAQSSIPKTNDSPVPGKREKYIYGMVVAGTPEVIAGRFAVVCPAGQLKEAIQNYKKAVGARGAVDNDKRDIQGYITKGELAAIKDPNWAKPLYNIGFGRTGSLDVDLREIVPGGYFNRNNLKILERLLENWRGNEGLPRRLTLRNGTFFRVDFESISLTDIAFECCWFSGYVSPFENTIVTGSEFRSCYFAGPFYDPMKPFLIFKDALLGNKSVLVSGPLLITECGSGAKSETTNKADEEFHRGGLSAPNPIPSPNGVGQARQDSLGVSANGLYYSKASRESRAQLLGTWQMKLRDELKTSETRPLRMVLALAQINSTIASESIKSSLGQVGNGYDNVREALKEANELISEVTAHDVNLDDGDRRILGEATAAYRDAVLEWLNVLSKANSPAASINVPGEPFGDAALPHHERRRCFQLLRPRFR
ncbi:unnamed protein product [uncultured bacterium]|nr:unnamed protein product [uncultured bacterium]